MSDALWVERRQQHEVRSRRQLAGRLRAEGPSFCSWSKRPYRRCSAHQHSDDEVMHVLRGSISFGPAERNRWLTLAAGDRIQPASGVHCLEAHC